MKYFLLLLLLYNSLQSQIKDGIFDAQTKKSIPYVSIWVENGKAGTTTDENGKFELNIYNHESRLIINSLGYRRRIIETKSIKDSILLDLEIIQLKEVKIFSKNKLSFKLGKLKKSNVEYAVIPEYNNRIIAKYFANELNTDDVLFVKKIKINTFAIFKDPILNIQFYSKKDDGSPGDLLCYKNIICKTKKGNHTNEINIDSLDILFPKNGLFVACENLLVEQNKLELNYDFRKNGTRSIFIYEPRIKMLDNSKQKEDWYFNGMEWKENQYGKSMAIELILGN